ncbi:MAG: NfeD family protein [Clostridiales bacterium]|nr:NfeD family protein [Clostridiales bacterium]
MENIMVWIWLAVIIMSLLIEISTVQLVSIWFTLAGAISLGLSFIPNFVWWAQILVFAVLSGILFFTFRPLLLKWQEKHQTKDMNTNLDLIVGMYVRMIKQADFDNLGEAKIGDVIWSIKSKDGEVLQENEIVKIVAIEGNKLIAEKQVTLDK